MENTKKPGRVRRAGLFLGALWTSGIGSAVLAAWNIGMWAHSFSVALAVVLIVCSLREILRWSFDQAFSRLAQMMMEVVNEAVSKRFGPQVVKHEVTHRHVEGKEPWE